MDRSQYEIRYLHSSHYQPRRWHRIAPGSDDNRTEAMNIGCGVIIRSTVRLETWVTEIDGVASTSTSMVFVAGSVVKRWVVVVRDHEIDEETGERVEGKISVEIEYAVLTSSDLKLASGQPGPVFVDDLLGWREAFVYRWHNADSEMPAPAEQEIRDALARRQQKGRSS